MRRLTLFCVAALVVLLAVPAYAEVQNIKVSGDLAARWIVRANYDLDENDTDTFGNDTDDYLMSTAEVQIDADLTDNVSAVVRLVNQRDWDDIGNASSQETNTTDFDVLVDLANVTLKEMIYSPLTVTIGRQDLWFGRGFIVGAKQRDPEGSVSADEYTAINSFDAIRGTLDFDPWTIDVVYSVIEENNVNQADDVYLGGLNIGYVFDSYNAEAEGYVFAKKDNTRISYNVPGTGTTCGDNLVKTWGLRGSFEPIPQASLAAEVAYQDGDYWVYATDGRERSAMAADISGDYHFKDVRWSPKVGLEYIYYSGEDSYLQADDGNFSGWDPMYRGKFDTAIREFQNVYYLTQQRALNVAQTELDQDSAVTNQHQLLIIGNVTPTDSLTVDGRVGFFWFDEELEVVSGEGDAGKSIGTELDLEFTYDYTEDVSFNLLTAFFFPGNYFAGGQDDTASDIVGSVSVAF